MTALLEALGGKKAFRDDPSSVGEWVRRIQAGLPVASALAFKDALHLTQEELGRLLGVSTRTVVRWGPGAKLDSVSGDRLVRSARLYSMAAEVLEDKSAAAQWLRAPQSALGGSVPLELAATDIGARAVESLLGRMEHGVYT